MGSGDTRRPAGMAELHGTLVVRLGCRASDETLLANSLLGAKTKGEGRGPSLSPGRDRAEPLPDWVLVFESYIGH
jgi:hypothetical protein